jgi:hypothetical protein
MGTESFYKFSIFLTDKVLINSSLDQFTYLQYVTVINICTFLSP